MSLFDDPLYQWRETYFLLCDRGKRPTQAAVEQALRQASGKYEIARSGPADDGKFESLTLVAPEDYAALDISYMEGEDVVEETAALVDELCLQITDAAERARLRKLTHCDARFDIMHFEQLSADPDDEAADGFDPSALLQALRALQKLVGGQVIDPQSGAAL